jgi:long-chain fatty acid transport protein
VVVRTCKGLTALLLACVLPSQAPVWASGYAIREQSSSALGNAFAGATAAAEDITFMFFNPAGLTRHAGHQVATSLSYIAPRASFDSDGADTVLGTPITGGDGGSDIGDDALVPAFYGLWDLAPDLKLGLGVNAPFGLSTTYEGGWVGRYHALDSELENVIVNPAIAYRLGGGLSLGAGLQLSYIDGRLTNAIDFGTIDSLLFGGAFGGVPSGSDGASEIDGDDWAVGYNLGLLFELDEGTRFALAYRSRIEHAIEGEADFDLGGPVGDGISGATGAFVDTDAAADITLPETLSFGFYHEPAPVWSIMGEAAWTNWSRVDELRITFDNPAQSDVVTSLGWEDSWFFALGAAYRPSDQLSLRLGVAHDQSPVPNNRRTPRIPDEDRSWISLGLTYRAIESLWLDLGYTHIFLDSADLNLSTADPNNRFRGDLSGDYDSAVDILTLQLRYRF